MLKRASTRTPRHLRVYAPRLEPLEDRLVLTTPGTWTPLTNLSPFASNGIGTMELLSDGTIMAQGGGVSNTWYKLKPDINGSYVNGTWSAMASMGLERLYTATNILQDGRVFVLGGEYSGPAGNATWINSGEVYNPQTNSWSSIPNFPRSEFGDDSSMLLPDGRVLCAYLSGPQTFIYNPTNNTWSNGPTKLDGDGSDEETWVKLPDGSILTYNIFSNPSHAQRLNVNTMTWIDSGTVPVQLYTSSGAETGGAVLLPDGRAFFIGGTSNTALYTPSAVPGGPGTWAAGPVIPGGYGANDAPCAMMPNGHVLIAVGTTPAFGPPTKIYEYDPTAPVGSSLTDVTPAAPDLSGTDAYTTRMLMLPSGQVLFTNGARQLYVYTPVGNPQNAWRPAITNVAYNGNGKYTLTGTQINGISAGASYGDDAEMDTNYPIVKLTSATGKVYYARTYNWSSTGVATGNTPLSTQFTLPAGTPFGTFTLTVIGSGIESPGVPFTTQPEAPTAVPDTYTTIEDTPLIVPKATGVLANDSDPFSLPLQAILTSNVSHGTLTLNADGSFNYLPSTNANNVNNPGPDHFSYKVNNGYFDSSVVTVTINVTAVNDAPTANDDGIPPSGVARYFVHPGQTLTIPSNIGVLANDYDPEIALGEGGPALTATRISSPFQGVMNSFNPDGSFSYTANPNGSGNDLFRYTASDGQRTSNSATVTIHVNNLAVANTDFFATKVNTGVSGNVLSNDTDPELDPLSAILVTNVANGTLVFNADGTFTYTPNAEFGGLDSFTYKTNDSWEDGGTATVNLRVDRLPVASGDVFTIKMNSSLEILSPGVLTNDSDADIPAFNDILMSQLVGMPGNGTLTLGANGYFKYVPNTGFVGVDTFSYQISDGLFAGNTAQVAINVKPIPIALPDSYSTLGTQIIVGSPAGLLANDTSPNMTPLSARLVTNPTNGSLTLNPDGSFNYVAHNGFSGVDSFTYVANDGIYDSDVTPVTLIVFNRNLPPVANDDAFNVAATGATTIIARGVLSNDTDPDGPASALVATLVSGPKNGSLLLNPDGGFVYTPIATFNGYDSFTYQASDNQALSNVATVTLTVGTPPPPPTNPNQRIILGQEAGGTLKVFAGETGNAIFSVTPYGPTFTGAIRVATGDLNGDGVPDIITAPGPLAGTSLPVRVFNGVNGTSLGGTLGTGVYPFGNKYAGGIEVAAGDLNGDGIADILAGADLATASSQVRTYNGATGIAFSGWYGSFNPYSGNAFGGVRVAAGDVNGDGRAEIIVTPAASTPTVKIYNPAATSLNTGLFKSFAGYSGNQAGGIFVSAGDLNGDGKAEVIVGGSASSPGQVRIFNGTTGTVLRNLSIAGANGTARVAVGDINGDGKLDLIVGITNGATSRARVYDAVTLTEMFGSSAFNFAANYTGGLFPAALNKRST